MSVTGWEERMSAKHRPTYPTDPVPMRRPTLRERVWWPRVGVGVWWLRIHPPRLLCQSCYEWKGRWLLANEPNEWEPYYYWQLTCGHDCKHGHHNLEVWIA